MKIPALSTDQPDPSTIHIMVVSTSHGTYSRIAGLLKQEKKINVFHQETGIEAVSTFRQYGLDVVIIDCSDPTENWHITITRIKKIDQDTMFVLVSTDPSPIDDPRDKAKLKYNSSEYFKIPNKHARKEDLASFREKFIRTLRSFSTVRRKKGKTAQPLGAPIDRIRKLQIAKLKAAEPVVVSLRPYTRTKPEVIAIASSTGGPRALTGFLGGLPRDINCPVVVTQHMLSGFTDSLVKGITKSTEWPCHEAINGTELLPGYIYMAPSGFHMTFEPGDPYPRIKLIDGEPENFCKPSADPMFKSIVRIYGAKVLGIVLTGMGSDGLNGATEIVKSGGNVIAQDQDTSVVWGMPRAVAEAGLCAAVKPIDALPGEAVRVLRSMV
jgi:two-component system chemotaxis response regulator CheB